MLSSRNKAVTVAILIGAAGLSGCADTFNNRDSVTFGLGNAIETNKAIQIIDPFPPYAENTTIMTHGRMLKPLPGTVTTTTATSTSTAQ